MLRRPKPSDCESDLLKEQERFLASGAPSSASVLRRPDKRRGQAGEVESGDGQGTGGQEKDVVTIEDLPEQLPSLMPAPAKKSRFKASHVTFEDDDAEGRLDSHDTHISAVLSRIVERDTSCTPISLPAFTGLAFPKVMHRTETSSKAATSPAGERKSIFARQIAAQKLNETKAQCAPAESREQNLTPEACMDVDVENSSFHSSLVSGHGLRSADGLAETMKIHAENQAKLQAMSQSEILEEQGKLLSQLDPRLVQFVKSRNAQSVPSSQLHKDCPRKEDCSKDGDRLSLQQKQTRGRPGRGFNEVEDMDNEEGEPEPPPSITEEDLPVKPQKEWIHMDKLEPEKLEWVKDLPPPRKKGTKMAMQARFNFAGSLIPPTEDLPTHLGLHHHGDEPERAGYSLQELFLLSRSQVTQQRSLALSTLAHILTKAHSGEYLSLLNGNVTSTLLDAGLVFLLRFALDDGVEGVMSSAVHALRALLVCDEDEECMDHTFSWFGGMASFPLTPSSQEEEDEEDEGLDELLKETAKEKEEKKSDYDVARQDVVKGLLKMKLLPRLRYILEVMRPSPRVVDGILKILTRIVRHSLSSATEVLNCPRLMETVMSEFLPTSWETPMSANPASLYGVPLAGAMKLLRVLAASGRHNCARLLNSLGVKEHLSCLLSAEPGELLLEPHQALRITTEAYRLWTVAVGYGQACQLYLDLYAALLKALQSGHQLAPPNDSLLPLQLHRLSALLSLLTQLTHTAGCHQELQAGLASGQSDQCPPPPPVAWGHVSGLHAPLMGNLKGLVKGLDDPLLKDSSLTLIPVYLLYFQAYYHQLSKQNFFRPVETLEELERLTPDVLLPLTRHTSVMELMKNLRSSSVVCKAQSKCPQPPASLPGLACTGWRDYQGLVASSSPFPLLIALGLLLETITEIHKGLGSKFAKFLLSESVIGYLRACSKARSTQSVSRAWLLRHEHHLLYLLLRLTHRLVPGNTEAAKHASLYHQVALLLLTWLLPGSEYLAHELLSTVIFNKDFLSEGHSGGPEAVELGELKLHDHPQLRASPSLQTVGALLREACVQLPSIRGCYLTHLAYLEPSFIASRNALLGRSPWVKSHLLPELTGPTLPSDWAFLPLIKLYEQTGVSGGGALAVEELPPGALQAAVHCLQWLLLLEVWREESLKMIPPVAKLARLSCVFLCSSDLFLERPVQKLMWGLFRLLTRASRLDSLDLSVPPPGLASFQDLYVAILAQYEAVSFGDRLFGCWLLLPLQRRYSPALRLAVFGEHVGVLRSLGVTLQQLSIPIERFTSPPEDSLPLLRLYFRSLVTGTLKLSWCPIFYIVAVSHVNSFIFSQDAAAQEVEASRHSMLRKIHYLTDEVLRSHLLLFRLPQPQSQLGFDMYEQLPPIRAKRLESVMHLDGSNLKGD